MNRLLKPGVLLFLLLFPGFAARPYHTDDPGTTEKGAFELELSADGGKNSLCPGFVFKHGFTDRMELDIPVSYVVLPSDERAVQPLGVYAKFALIPDRAAITFSGSMSDPAYAINGIVSHSFGLLTVNANIGSSMIANTNDIDLTYGLATLLTFGKFETGVEITGTQEETEWWQVGAKYFVSNRFSVDFGFGGGFSSRESLSVTTGLCFAFPLKSD